MATTETIATKKVTDLATQASMADTDLMTAGSPSTGALKKITWANIIAAIKTKLGGAAVCSVVNNKTTTASGTVLDGRMGKTLGDEISALNTNIKKDVSDQFNWGTCTDYSAIQIGKIIFFRATCNTKSAASMTFATLKDASLAPSASVILNTHSISGADSAKRSYAYIATSGYITLNTYASYTDLAGAAWSGGCMVDGWWVVP